MESNNWVNLDHSEIKEIESRIKEQADKDVFQRLITRINSRKDPNLALSALIKACKFLETKKILNIKKNGKDYDDLDFPELLDIMSGKNPPEGHSPEGRYSVGIGENYDTVFERRYISGIGALLRETVRNIFAAIEAEHLEEAS